MASVSIGNKIKLELDEFCYKNNKRQVDVVTEAVKKYMEGYK